MSKIAIFGYASCISLPLWRGSPGRISVKFFADVKGMAKVSSAIEILPKI